MVWSDWYIHLKAAQEGSQLTLADIAAVLTQDYGVKCGRAAVGHWLNGVRDPDVRVLFAICTILKVDPAEILFENPAFRDVSRDSIQVAVAYEALPEAERAVARRVLRMPEPVGRGYKKGAPPHSAAAWPRPSRPW